VKNAQNSDHTATSTYQHDLLLLQPAVVFGSLQLLVGELFFDTRLLELLQPQLFFRLVSFDLLRHLRPVHGHGDYRQCQQTRTKASETITVYDNAATRREPFLSSSLCLLTCAPIGSKPKPSSDRSFNWTSKPMSSDQTCVVLFLSTPTRDNGKINNMLAIGVRNCIACWALTSDVIIFGADFGGTTGRDGAYIPGWAVGWYAGAPPCGGYAPRAGGPGKPGRLGCAEQKKTSVWSSGSQPFLAHGPSFAKQYPMDHFATLTPHELPDETFQERFITDLWYSPWTTRNSWESESLF